MNSGSRGTVMPIGLNVLAKAGSPAIVTSTVEMPADLSVLILASNSAGRPTTHSTLTPYFFTKAAVTAFLTSSPSPVATTMLPSFLASARVLSQTICSGEPEGDFAAAGLDDVEPASVLPVETASRKTARMKPQK